MDIDPGDLLLFARVVECGSFSRAAQRVDLPKSTLSRRISLLEAKLGERLLLRTTRKLALTEFGASLLEHARKVVEETEAAGALAQHRQAGPSGLLRISMPADFGDTLMRQVLAEFVRRYPAISLELDLSARRVDLLEENFDVTLRSHSEPLEDSGLYRKALGTLKYVLVASPSFIATLPQGLSAEQLSILPTLVRKTPWAGTQWELTHPQEGLRKVSLTPRLVSNNLLVLRQAAIDGLGITLLPEMACRQELVHGKLQRVLPDWHTPPSSVSALYASHKGQSSALRAFLDYLAEKLQGAL